MTASTADAIKPFSLPRAVRFEPDEPVEARELPDIPDDRPDDERERERPPLLDELPPRPPGLEPLPDFMLPPDLEPPDVFADEARPELELRLPEPELLRPLELRLPEPELLRPLELRLPEPELLRALELRLPEPELLRALELRLPEPVDPERPPDAVFLLVEPELLRFAAPARELAAPEDLPDEEVFLAELPEVFLADELRDDDDELLVPLLFDPAFEPPGERDEVDLFEVDEPDFLAPELRPDVEEREVDDLFVVGIFILPKNESSSGTSVRDL